jgi:hypothetical protein
MAVYAEPILDRLLKLLENRKTQLKPHIILSIGKIAFVAAAIVEPHLEIIRSVSETSVIIVHVVKLSLSNRKLKSDTIGDNLTGTHNIFIYDNKP